MSRRIVTRKDLESVITFTGLTNDDVHFLAQAAQGICPDVHIESRFGGFQYPVKEIGENAYVYQGVIRWSYQVGENGEYRLTYTDANSSYLIRRMLEQMGFEILIEVQHPNLGELSLEPGVTITHKLTINGRSFTFDLSTPPAQNPQAD